MQDTAIAVERMFKTVAEVGGNNVISLPDVNMLELDNDAAELSVHLNTNPRSRYLMTVRMLDQVQFSDLQGEVETSIHNSLCNRIASNIDSKKPGDKVLSIVDRHTDKFGKPHKRITGDVLLLWKERGSTLMKILYTEYSVGDLGMKYFVINDDKFDGSRSIIDGMQDVMRKKLCE